MLVIIADLFFECIFISTCFQYISKKCSSQQQVCSYGKKSAVWLEKITNYSEGWVSKNSRLFLWSLHLCVYLFSLYRNNFFILQNFQQFVYYFKMTDSFQLCQKIGCNYSKLLQTTRKVVLVIKAEICYLTYCILPLLT